MKHLVAYVNEHKKEAIIGWTKDKETSARRARFLGDGWDSRVDSKIYFGSDELARLDIYCIFYKSGYTMKNQGVPGKPLDKELMFKKHGLEFLLSDGAIDYMVPGRSYPQFPDKHLRRNPSYVVS